MDDFPRCNAQTEARPTVGVKSWPCITTEELYRHFTTVTSTQKATYTSSTSCYTHMSAKTFPVSLLSISNPAIIHMHLISEQDTERADKREIWPPPPTVWFSHSRERARLSFCTQSTQWWQRRGVCAWCRRWQRRWHRKWLWPPHSKGFLKRESEAGSMRIFNADHTHSHAERFPRVGRHSKVAALLGNSLDRGGE